MGFSALHRLRIRSRGLALATLALYALNWVGLALMPCAMAYAAPTAVSATVATVAPDSAAADVEMTPECHARMAGAPAAGPDAPSVVHDAPSTSCPWCAGAGPASGAAHHDGGCGAMPKPALDARDVKSFQSPLLVALSATVLAVLPLDVLAPPAMAAEPVLPPDAPAPDRYCRRLE